MGNTTTLSYTDDKFLEEKLTQHSKNTGISKSKIIASALKLYFDEIDEDEIDLKLAMKISEKIESGEMKTYSLEEVCKELKL